jgi:hypothetical protein
MRKWISDWKVNPFRKRKDCNVKDAFIKGMPITKKDQLLQLVFTLNGIL